MKLKKSLLSKEVSPYFSPYTVRKVQLLESSERTKKLLEGIHMGEQLSMLVTALDMLVGSDSLQYFNALLYGFNQTPQHKSVKMYESAGNVVEAMVPNELLVELKQIITISKAEEHGFIYDEKRNSYSFNVNIFVKHFNRRCHVRSTKDGRLFLYNNKGVFEELSEVELGKVIRTLMHEGRLYSWNSKSEAEAVRALLRDSNTVEEMNTMRNFINLKNGMLSLETFELLPHHPNYLSTVQLPIEYDHSATAPSFMQFIKEISLDDEELILVLQEIMGYLLSAETKAEKAFFFYGGGANGKSVLASIITQLVGVENVSSIPLSEFSQQFGLEGLINKTVNIAAENEMGGKALKTENFKAIVSGDTKHVSIDDLKQLFEQFLINAKEKYNHFYEFELEDSTYDIEWVEWAYVVSCPVCDSPIVLREENKVMKEDGKYKNGFYNCSNKDCSTNTGNKIGVKRTDCKPLSSTPIRLKISNKKTLNTFVHVLTNREIEDIKQRDYSYYLTSQLVKPDGDIPEDWDRTHEDKLFEKGVSKFPFSIFDSMVSNSFSNSIHELKCFVKS